MHVQDYDAALQVSSEHVLAHIRKGMVLQALKRPEVFFPSFPSMMRCLVRFDRRSKCSNQNPGAVSPRNTN